MHPFCRCTDCPYIPGRKTVRAARDENGKSIQVPGDMTYDEWYEKCGKETSYTSHVSSADREQFERYRSVLKNLCPKTIEEFLEIKYNNSEKYESLKIDFADEKIKNNIRNGKYNTTVLMGKQGKHILGHNNYIDGRSYLLPGIDAQKLVDEFAGTGVLKRDKKGKWTRKEVVKAKEVIGVVISDIDNRKKETKSFTIHYSNKGVHIVPAWEIEDENI